MQAMDPVQVVALSDDLADRHGGAFASQPKAGMALLRGRESVRSERYNLGEIPLSTAHVTLNDGAGGRVHGGASIMADDARLATAIAVCDGVLAAGLDGWRDVLAMVVEGADVLDARERDRAMMRSKTRTDFSLLNDASGRLGDMDGPGDRNGVAG